MDKKVKNDELLKRGTEQVIVKDSLTKKLTQSKHLRVKLGIDPTSSKLHLGHTVVLRKLKQFQALGHQVIFLVGDFTARIGDPSDRLSARKPLERKDIQKNMESYKEQVGRVLDLSKVEIRYNSEWHQDMDFAELFELAALFTVNQMLERDMFQQRMGKKKPLWIHELLYPILQGYDSVALQADVEVGGTDQTFNMLTARLIQPKYSQPPQDIMTVQLLEGTEGKKKMSKSVGNTINLTDSPQEMFGKVMSITDQLIIKYFTLLTDVPLVMVNDYAKAMKKGDNPRDYKSKLALELVSMKKKKKEAVAAEKEFNRVFKDKKIPSDIHERVRFAESTGTATVMVSDLFKCSRSEVRRLIKQGAVRRAISKGPVYKKYKRNAFKDWPI